MIKATVFRYLAILAVVVSVGQAEGGQEVSAGDSLRKVVSLLGEPRGKLQKGGFVVLYYGDRGTVTLREGKVSNANLVSLEDATNKAEARARKAEARREREQKARLDRIEKGNDEKRKKEKDAEFAALPAGQRLAYWKTFRRLYPEVPVNLIITPLQEEADELQESAEAASAANANRKAIEARIKEVEEAIVEASAKVASPTIWRSVRERVKGDRTKLRAELAKLKKKLAGETE